MYRRALVTFGILLLIPALSHAGIVYHQIEYTGTVAGGSVGFHFPDGTVRPGSDPGDMGMILIPSNGGANMQIQFGLGTDAGVIVTTGSPSLLAQKLSAGDWIDGATPVDTASLPGYSTAFDKGGGKIRFFGSGNFLSGERGYIGFRLMGGAFYGWAEVSVIDNTSFTVHRVAYEDSGAPIQAGDPGGGVLALANGAIANDTGLNWPAGLWNVRAIQLDESGNAVGELSDGFQFNAPGTLYPAFVQAYLFTSATPSHRLRVFRSVDPLETGSVDVEFADFSCEDGSGGLEHYCESTLPFHLGSVGQLTDEMFTETGVVPGRSRVGVASVRRSGGGNIPSFNWAEGPWYVRSLLVDSSGTPIGELSEGFMIDFDNYHPIAEPDLFSSAAPSDRIRFYRKTSPISPGDIGIEFAEFSCDDGTGNVSTLCSPLPPDAHFDDRVWLRDPDFSPGDVPPAPTSVPGTTVRMRASVSSHPNPFNPAVTIRYSVPVGGDVAVRVYDMAGRLVRVLARGHSQPGEHSLRWDGRDGSGQPVGSGVYLMRVSTPEGEVTSKATLLR